MKAQHRLLQSDLISRKQAENDSGFSLLETTISLLLMAIVGLGATSLFFFVVRNTVSASDRELAMAVGQQRMEQLRNASFNDATLDQTATSGSSTSVTRAGRQYSINTTIINSDLVNGSATTKTITVRVTPDSESSAWARTISSVFGSVTLITERSAQTVGPNRAL